MYIPESIRNAEDYQACINFHGHTCMGVTIGYLAAKLALDTLGIERAVDEELIAIVENDACCCDAIQVLTGCTFGKGNFFFRDYGKMAFTFGNRTTNHSIRLVLKPGVFDLPQEEQELAERIREGKAAPTEIVRYESLSESRLDDLFRDSPAAFFDVHEVPLTLPPHAAREPSVACAICQEMVMQTKLLKSGNQLICKGCLEA